MSRFLFLFSLLHASAAVVTRESLIADDIATSYSYNMNNWMSSAVIAMSTYGGNVANAPMTIVSLHKEPKFMGDTQQALWALKASIVGRSLYVGYENHAFQIYITELAFYGYEGPNYNPATVNCPASLTSGSITGYCRNHWHYSSTGVANNHSVALFARAYDTTIRPWYQDTKAFKKPKWSTISSFSSSTATVTYVGCTFTAPFYDKAGVLLGVIASDLDSVFYTQVFIDTYKQDDVLAYIVEASTYSLVATTTGEESYNYKTAKIKKCTQSIDPITYLSANYVTKGNTTWFADGDYVLGTGGVTYNIHVKTWVDAYATITHKIIVVGIVKDYYTATSVDYTATVNEAMTSTKDNIKNIWGIVMGITATNVFQHAASDVYPLGTAMASYYTPPRQGTTQQALWALHYSFNRNVRDLIPTIATGYSDNTYMRYGLVDYIPNYMYGGQNSASCVIAGVNTANCLSKYNVHSNGTIDGPPTSQYSYVVTGRPWYTGCKNYGSAQWGTLGASAFDNSLLLQLYSMPIYQHPNLDTLMGVATTGISLAHLNGLLSTSYTAYIVHVTDGYLMANSVGALVYDSVTAKYIKATDSVNTIIAKSYSYLISVGHYRDGATTTSYTDANGFKWDMVITLAYMRDSTGTNEIHIVYVDLQDPNAAATPAAAPTTDSSFSLSDDEITVAADSSQAAAVLSGLTLLLGIVMSIVFFVMSKSQSSLLGVRSSENSKL